MQPVMNLLLGSVFFIAVLCICSSTLWILVFPLNESPKTAIGRFIFSVYWCFIFLVIIAGTLGEFARRETSPLPWRACQIGFERHGLAEAAFQFVIVSLVDLWIFVVPARIYSINVTSISNRERVLVYLLNIAFGLILVTPGNPIYNLLDSHSGYD